MDNKSENLVEKNNYKLKIIKLSNYDLHLLLNELHELLKFDNRDNSTTIYLYENIASQLHYEKVKVVVEKEKRFLEKIKNVIKLMFNLQK